MGVGTRAADDPDAPRVAMLSRGGYWARCVQTGRGLMILNQPVICAILHSRLEMSCWIGQ